MQNLEFGEVFTDHMLTIQWTVESGWERPRIRPLKAFDMHPGAQVLHYANVIFEGMKAARAADGTVRMYRPRDHLSRLNFSATRCSLPVSSPFDTPKCALNYRISMRSNYLNA